MTLIASDKGIFSMWVRLDEDTQSRYMVYAARQNGPPFIELNVFFTGSQYDINLADTGTSAGFQVETTSGVVATTNSSLRNLLCSWDLSVPIVHLYLDDLSDANLVFSTTGNIQWDKVNRLSIFSITPYVANWWDGCCAQVYLNTQEYLDFSIVSNRRFFIDGSGQMVDLGTNGEVPTGNSPSFYFHGDSTTFPTNFGTEFAVPLVGVLINCTTFIPPFAVDNQGSSYLYIEVPVGYYGAIAYSPSLDRVVAIGYDNDIKLALLTSEDGINWTRRPSSGISNVIWKGIEWSPTLSIFIGVGLHFSGSGVISSPDGITWTPRTTPNANQWSQVAWSPSLGLFAVVGSPDDTADTVITSSDGIIWTAQTVPTNNVFGWSDVAWSPTLGLFAAVGQTTTQTGVITSSDGINWTSRTTPTDFDNNTINTIIWNPDIAEFIALAYIPNNDSIIVLRSSNGITWTSNTAIGSNWTDLAWSTDLVLYAAVSDTPSPNSIMTSPDGTSWTFQSGDTDSSWSRVIWVSSYGLFIAVASGGSRTVHRIMTSPDGITWTERLTPVL